MDPVPDVLKAIFERGNAMQSYWSFYISVSLAMLAFFGSAQRSRLIAIIMSLGFVGFAAINCSALLQRAGERHELYRLAGSEDPGAIPAKWSPLLIASEPPTPDSILKGHIAMDLSILAAIWLLTLRPREAK